MNEEIKTEWLEALRGGEYQQAHAHLKEGDNFCCLGVLCDLHIKKNGGEWAVHNFKKKAGDPVAYQYMANSVILPMEVAQWAGLGQHGNRAPEVKVDQYSFRLDDLNDEGKTFTELADLIEAQF